MVVAILLAVLTSVAQASPAYVPERVYDTRRASFVDFEVMLADLTRADVVFVGEQHDDPNTHRLEHAVLDGLRRRRVPLTVSLEMFERDVQDVVGRYLTGSITEAQLLEDARPWPRYASDYRPLLELAKSEKWQVVAANVPRRFASDVAKSGKDALDRLSPADRALVARDVLCPQDGYFRRFVNAMEDHSTPSTSADKPSTDKPSTDKPSTDKPSTVKAPVEKPAPSKPSAEQAAADLRSEEQMTERYYWSQCVKDETMAESIARAYESRSGGTGAIVHFNGAFHSDFGQGTAERTRRRLPGRRVTILTILPVTDLDTLAPAGEDLTRADYLVYTVK
jgi:uncharacterized iron-regulated protein